MKESEILEHAQAGKICSSYVRIDLWDIDSIMQEFGFISRAEKELALRRLILKEEIARR